MEQKQNAEQKYKIRNRNILDSHITICSYVAAD